MPCWKEQDLKDSARLPCTNSVLGHDEELPLRDLGNSDTRTKVGARIVDTCADFRVSNVVQIFIMSMVPRLTVARTKIINTPMTDALCFRYQSGQCKSNGFGFIGSNVS